MGTTEPGAEGHYTTAAKMTRKKNTVRVPIADESSSGSESEEAKITPERGP